MRREDYTWEQIGVFYRFGIFWLVFLAIHAGFEALSQVQQAEQHAQPFAWTDWFIEWARSTFENLQSEAWQVAASIWYVERRLNKEREFKGAG